MKNKKIQRVLCFCLALLCCFTLTDVFAPMRAKAIAVELGWVTYIIIAAMAAMGIGATVSGGISALENAVNERVDEYYEVTGIDVLGAVSQAVRMGTGGSGGSGGDNTGVKLILGSTIVVMIVEFVEWLREVCGWNAGSEIVANSDYIEFWAYLNGEYRPFKTTTLGARISSSSTYGVYQVETLGDALYTSELGHLSKDVFYYRYLDANSEYKYGFFYTADNMPITAAIYYYAYPSLTSTGSYASVNFKNFSSYGVNADDVVGITFFNSLDTIKWGLLTSNNTVLVKSSVGMHFDTNPENYTIVSDNATITVPQEFTDITTSETEELEIYSPNFIGTSPQEIAEGFKQYVIDTGTIPEITTEVVTLPEPAPTPVITPMPSPTVTDIEDMGLPQLGEVLMTRFPFSIPRDISRIVSVITADRQPPKWEVDFYSPLADKVAFQGDTKITIDMAEYETVGQICRWTSVIGFCLFLILITKSLIGW